MGLGLVLLIVVLVLQAAIGLMRAPWRIGRLAGRQTP
jgi:hypothetical protein